MMRALVLSIPGILLWVSAFTAGGLWANGQWWGVFVCGPVFIGAGVWHDYWIERFGA